MDTLGVAEAAALLHLNPKRVQYLARTGRLPAVRLGRKWLFPRHQLEGMLGPGNGPRPAPHSIDLSARNQLRGTVAVISTEGLMAEIVVGIGDQELVSVITKSAAERLRLRVGDEVYAVIKSTEVMIGRG